MKVNHYNHGIHDPSSYVEISGVSTEEYAELANNWSGAPNSALTLKNNRGFFAYTTKINGADPDVNNPGFFKIGDAIYSYNPDGGVGSEQPDGTYSVTAIDRISGEVPTNGFKAADKWQIENYVKDGVSLTYINKTHSDLNWITLDSYQINIPVTRASTDPNTGIVTNFTFGGDKVLASNNVMYTTLLPLVNTIELPGTSVIPTYRGTSGTSIENSIFSNPTNSTSPRQASYLKDSDFYSIDLNENNEFTVPKLIASRTNQTNQMQGTPSSELYLQLVSTKSNLTPVIDTQRVSLITTTNRIADVDYTTGEFALGRAKEYYFNATELNEDGLSTTFGTNANDGIGSEAVEDFNPANYITKLATLQNACTGLRIEFAAFNPSSATDIDVYVKALSGEESNPTDIDWVRLTDPNYSSTQDEQFFKDSRYEFDITNAGAKPNATFTQFQIKIRMRSKNQAVVPIIKDLRCIALA